MVPLEARHERRGDRGRGGARKALLTLTFTPLLIAAVQEPAKKPVEPLKTPPRAYFTDHCQRCHGIDGGNFIPGFAEEPETKLRADIVRMADGPGGASLKPEDVEAQIAYHRLISEGKPFVAWTSREGLVLKGEITDGATLTANVGTPKVDENDGWTLTLPSEADFTKLKLTATLDKKSTEFTPSESAFSIPTKKKEPARL